MEDHGEKILSLRIAWTRLAWTTSVRRGEKRRGEERKEGEGRGEKRKIIENVTRLAFLIFFFPLREGFRGLEGWLRG